MQTESPKQTMIVATCLCLVCSVLVSTAAVVLRPAQQIQKTLDIQKNILKVAGIYDETRKVDTQFKVVEPVLIELAGKRPRITDPSEEGIDLKTYDPKKAAKKEHENHHGHCQHGEARQRYAAPAPGIRRRSRSASQGDGDGQTVIRAARLLKTG